MQRTIINFCYKLSVVSYRNFEASATLSYLPMCLQFSVVCILTVNSDFHLVSFPFCLGAFLTFSYNVVLMMMNHFSFCVSEKK